MYKVYKNYARALYDLGLYIMYVCMYTYLYIYVYSIFNLIALPTKCDLILIIGESE